MEPSRSAFDDGRDTDPERVSASAATAERRAQLRAAKALDHLANERTLLTWVRLAVTVIVLGFVVARFGIFLEQIATQQRRVLHTPGLTLAIGVALVLGGAGLTILAGIRYFAVEREIEQGRLRPRYTLVYALLAASALASIVLAAYLVYAQLSTGAGPTG